jgi:hypothetical protein
MSPNLTSPVVGSLLLACLASAAHAQPAPDAAPAPEPDPMIPADPPTTASVADPFVQKPSAPEPPPPEPTTEPTEPAPEPEVDWSAAPPPDQVSGVERAAPTPVSHHLLWIPRAVLFVPRWTFWLAAQPFRLGVWSYQHYHLDNRVKRALFNTEETLGIYPVGSYESGFGFSGGVRVVARDVFGHGERAKLRADWGGHYFQAYGISMSSGDLISKHLELELDGRYQRKPREVFYGIGNADHVDELEAPPPMPIDPTMSDVAIETRFREDVWRARLAAKVKLGGPVAFRLSGALNRREFSGDGVPADDVPIDTVYAVAGRPGFADPVTSAYGEAELILDTRHQTSPYQSKAVDASGWFMNAYLGGARGLGDDPTDYYRYGGEIQRFIDLYRGSRVLALRVMVEAIGGTTIRDNQIPLTDLPRLGGVEYLRGYKDSRFRDRALTLGTVEYSWDLGNYLAGYGFVDFGRVWPDLRDFEFEAFRVGFGGGIQVHTNSSFVMRAQVAANRTGDVLLQITFSPVFGRRERLGRYY